MPVKAFFELKIDRYATVPTEQHLLNFLGPVVNRQSDNVKSEFLGIVRGFKSKKSKRVKFVASKARITTAKGHFKGRAIVGAAGTNSLRTPIVWLEGGTAWRARGMSANWVSKTTPGSTRVGAGKGYALNSWGRYPGIEARNFRDVIVNDLEPSFFKDAQDNFHRMYSALGW